MIGFVPASELYDASTGNTVAQQDLGGSSLRLPMLLPDQLENNDAPAFVAGADNPQHDVPPDQSSSLRS